MDATKLPDDANELKFFIEDANFYTLWKYGTPRLNDEDFYRLNEITPLPAYDLKRVYNFLEMRLELAGVEFSTIGFYSDKETKKELNIPTNLSQAAKKSLQNLFKGTGNNKDINQMQDRLTNIFQQMYFQPDFSDEDLLKIKEHIDKYVDDFLNKDLFVFNTNYLSFEAQKSFFLNKIEKMKALEKFGENFIISDIQENNGFLFVHTLYALQKLQYLGILRLWHTRDYYEKITFFANVIIFDPLIEEINRKFKEVNPSLIYEEYNDSQKSIRFASKIIELSKGKKETDAVLLMKTVSKDPARYWFEDEILEDWHYETGDASQKKVYFAARKINQIIKDETQVADFLDHNTSKFRINPKYLKVDG